MCQILTVHMVQSLKQNFCHDFNLPSLEHPVWPLEQDVLKVANKMLKHHNFLTRNIIDQTTKGVVVLYKREGVDFVPKKIRTARTDSFENDIFWRLIISTVD